MIITCKKCGNDMTNKVNQVMINEIILNGKKYIDSNGNEVKLCKMKQDEVQVPDAGLGWAGVPWEGPRCLVCRAARTFRHQGGGGGQGQGRFRPPRGSSLYKHLSGPLGRLAWASGKVVVCISTSTLTLSWPSCPLFGTQSGRGLGPFGLP